MPNQTTFSSKCGDRNKVKPLFGTASLLKPAQLLLVHSFPRCDNVVLPSTRHVAIAQLCLRWHAVLPSPPPPRGSPPPLILMINNPAGCFNTETDFQLSKWYSSLSRHSSTIGTPQMMAPLLCSAQPNAEIGRPSRGWPSLERRLGRRARVETLYCTLS